MAFRSVVNRRQLCGSPARRPVTGALAALLVACFAAAPSSAGGQSKDTPKLVVTVESQASGVEAAALRSGISDALQIQAFSLAEASAKNMDAVLSVSVTEDHQVTMLFQSADGRAQLFSIAIDPRRPDKVSSIVSFIAAFVRYHWPGSSAPAQRGLASTSPPMLFNPYLQKSAPAQKKGGKCWLPPWNPYYGHVL